MKRTQQPIREIEFGNWKVSEEYGILKSPENKEMVLEPRLSRLMYLLGEKVDTIVTRSYLVSNMWKETIVNEESLTRAVADLRKVLKKNFSNALIIETIPKRGYRLTVNDAHKPTALFGFRYSRKYAVYASIVFVMTIMWLAGFLKVVVN